ncbi:hypothetical protein N7448_002498 [Penicillium atrosanguineum]|nr:hypothetical protein N7448_002498 [Penicillium atrosanguineum]
MSEVPGPQDTLFSHYVCAPFIFEKETVVKDFLEGKLPEHVSQAIFALASIFIDDTGSLMSPDQADKWANNASQHCLLQAHRPSLDLIQACHICATYWFARGEVHRAKLHAHVACVAARGLGYNRVGVPGFGAETVSLANRNLGFRCFWNCWVILVVILKDDVFTMSASDSTLPPLPPSPPPSPGSLYATPDASKTTSQYQNHGLLEYFHLLYIYHDIQIFKSKTTNSTKEKIDQISQFRQRIIRFHDRFPLLQFPGSYEAYGRSHLSTAFAIHSFYNLAMISLHSFLVPLFTGIPLNDCISAEVIEVCARTTIHHAKSFVEMIHAFFSAGVFASFLDQDVALSADLHSQVISCLVVLNDLQQYWVPLRRLFRQILGSVKGFISIHDIDEQRRALKQDPSSIICLGSDFSLDFSKYMHPNRSSNKLYSFSYISHDEEYEENLLVQDSEQLTPGSENILFTFETSNTGCDSFMQVSDFASDDFGFGADFMPGNGWEDEKFVESRIPTTSYPFL